MNLLQKFLAEFDMFHAQPTLRAKKEPQMSSYASSIISVLLFLFFGYVFIINVHGVLTYVKIDSVQTETKLPGGEVAADNIYFAVRIGYLPVNESLVNFDMEIRVATDTELLHTVGLVPCQPQAWREAGDDYQKQFQQYQLSEFFCPESSEHLDLNKVFYAPNSTYIIVSIKPCTSGPHCLNQTEQQESVRAIQEEEDAIFVLVYFLDTLISPQKQNPITRTINTDTELAFTNKRGIIATIELASYKITTDKGVMPIEDIEEHTGNFMQSFRQTSISIENRQDNYALIYMSMNRRCILIERKVGKLDEMLSYAGGLFSIIIGFLSIFLYSYNEYRYELLVAEGIYIQDEDGNSVKQSHLTFFKYVKYTIFDWCKVLLCQQINWDDCKSIDIAREEASEQMDVTNLFRKISSFEQLLSTIVPEQQRICNSLIKPCSLSQIQNNRNVLAYYSAVLGDEMATTLNEYKVAQKILLFTSRHCDAPVFRDSASLTPEQRRNSTKLQDFLIIDRTESNLEIIQNYIKFSDGFDSITLDPQMEEVERLITRSYFGLSEQKRQELEERIPIKILARLHYRHSVSLMKTYPKNIDQTSSTP